jgi:Glycosyltransferase sugar-binding region containing DXD motif
MREPLKSLLRPVYSRIFSCPVNVSSLYTKVPPLNQRIPNVVYQTWKRPVLSLRHAHAVRRFRKMNRDYSFCFFDDSQMLEYMTRHFTDHPILKVFEEIRIPASRADVWRYCMLYTEGGIYCDIDSVLTVPFRQLLSENPSEMISFEGGKWHDFLDRENYSAPGAFVSGPSESVRKLLECPEHTVLNWLLCFEKKNPILAEIIDLIVEQAGFFRGREFHSIWKAVTHFTGPLAFTQAVWRWIQKTHRRPTQCGVDFRGHGIFKVPGEEHRYAVSPHYTEMSRSPVLGSRVS